MKTLSRKVVKILKEGGILQAKMKVDENLKFDERDEARLVGGV